MTKEQIFEIVMQEDFLNELFDRLQKIKAERLRTTTPIRAMVAERSKMIEDRLTDWYNMGIKLTLITPYQYRFTKGSQRLDYFITSGKYFHIDKNKRGTIRADKIPTQL